MPPRFAYWTILIDNTPTAFRARDREELLPTVTQLRRTNQHVELKWFAQGKLWASPEAQHASWQKPKPADGRRDRDWRPGGDHKDPRARFDKEANRRRKREQRAQWNAPRPPAPRFGGEAGAPPRPGWNNRPPKSGGSQPERPRDQRPRPEWKNRPRESEPTNRPPRPDWKNRPPREHAWNDRPPHENWKNRPRRDDWKPQPPPEGGAKPRAGGKPWTSKPARKPWSGKPPAGKPWTATPHDGKRWGNKPGGKPWARKPRPNDRAQSSAPPAERGRDNGPAARKRDDEPPDNQ